MKASFTEKITVHSTFTVIFFTGDIDQVTQGIYMAIFVPLSALLIIIIILIPVIVCYISHKR